MKTENSGRAVLPGKALLLAVLPFALPAGVTLLLVGLAGHWPRDIAPGSGLKLAGLVAATLTALVAWRVSVRAATAPGPRRIAAVLCLMVGLLGWPLWSMGVFPSVNGSVLRDDRTVEMTLEKIEATPQRQSRDLHHWAWLAPKTAEAGLAGGRYFVSQATYDRLSAKAPATVEVEAATGLLGAVVVLAIR